MRAPGKCMEFQWVKIPPGNSTTSDVSEAMIHPPTRAATGRTLSESRVP